MGDVCVSLPGVQTQSPFSSLLHPALNFLFHTWCSLNTQVPHPHMYHKLAALFSFIGHS